MADAKSFVKPLWYWVLLIVLVAVIALTAVPAFTVTGGLVAWVAVGYLGKIALLAVGLLGGRALGCDTRVIGISLIVAILVGMFAEATVLAQARILAVEPKKGESADRP